MKKLTQISVVIAFVVIVLGAYVRVSDAGLGCPDWPGCYGKLLLSQDVDFVDQANRDFPERPLHKGKAWKEMGHRYAAGFLGLCILFIAIGELLSRSLANMRPVVVIMVVMVVLQSLLGMWTVTLLLQPLVVVAHLLGGMTILALLYWHMLELAVPRGEQRITAHAPRLLYWVLAGLLILLIQIALGGWMSSNYAALACPDFPTCRGQWWPPMDFNKGFSLWYGIGSDHEGGILQLDARTAIHISHRIGAAVTVLFLAWVAIKTMLQDDSSLRMISVIILIFLSLQTLLGVLNVVMSVPLIMAVLHNAVGALLLLSVVHLLHCVKK